MFVQIIKYQNLNFKYTWAVLCVFRGSGLGSLPRQRRSTQVQVRGSLSWLVTCIGHITEFLRFGSLSVRGQTWSCESWQSGSSVGVDLPHLILASSACRTCKVALSTTPSLRKRCREFPFAKRTSPTALSYSVARDKLPPHLPPNQHYRLILPSQPGTSVCQRPPVHSLCPLRLPTGCCPHLPAEAPHVTVTANFTWPNSGQCSPSLTLFITTPGAGNGFLLF